MAAAAASADVLIDKDIVYTVPDGERLELTLYYPDQKVELLRPAVVLIHGGAWRTGSRRQMRWYGDALARHGYVAAAVDYRLMPDYSFPAPLEDVQSAVRWLRLHAREYGVDAERVAALGTSAGGHLAALLATTDPDNDAKGTANMGASSRIEAAIVLYGAVDLVKMRKPPCMARLIGITMHYLKRFAGPDRKSLAVASPATHANPDTCPLLLIHGEEDRIVPYENALHFYDQLRGLAVPVRLITVSGGRHAFDRINSRQREAVFEEILAFLRQYL
jgi:acetyl esterase/lipase